MGIKLKEHNINVIIFLYYQENNEKKGSGKGRRQVKLKIGRNERRGEKKIGRNKRILFK